MRKLPSLAATIAQMEEQHDQLLQQIAELEKRVERTLEEVVRTFSPGAATPTPASE